MSDEELSDDHDYNSGPYCRHWCDPSDCKDKCDACHHGCVEHDLGPSARCCVKDCACEKWIERDQELAEAVNDAAAREAAAREAVERG